jgi:hypothetical protein
MTNRKLSPAVLIAAAMLATPAVAREHHQKSWHDANGSYVAPSSVIYANGRHCIMAQDVGAYASQPYKSPPCEPASWH